MTGPVRHTYRAAEAGLCVNSYLVEAESGVVVVDTNLLVCDIAALRARLAALKKPLLAVLVTHAHPDHSNGVLDLVKDREVPVYAAASVARVIEEIPGRNGRSGGRCTGPNGPPRRTTRTRCWPTASRSSSTS
jgi:glyoxylase-like metal-dependent hydrolase (beta-lactamase superfamily II)